MQPITTTGIIIDYFDITPFNGPHSFTIQDEQGFQIDFIVCQQAANIKMDLILQQQI